MNIGDVLLRNVFVFLFALPGALALADREADLRARIALLEVANPGAEKRLEPACSAVRGTVRLTLLLMGKYAVIQQPGLNPARDFEAFRRWCTEQRIDQAVYGEVRARVGGGYDVALRVYDRLQNRITIEREERAQGMLDVFEATDAAVLALFEALSGEHVAFGTVALERRGEEGECIVLIDGVEAGRGPSSVRNVLIGARTVEVRQLRLTGWAELARERVVVPEDGSVTVRFEVPYLTAEEKTRLAGYDAIIAERFYDAQAPSEVTGAIRAAIDFIGAVPSLGHLDSLQQEYRMKAGLHDVYAAELMLRLEQPTDQAFVTLGELAVQSGGFVRPDEMQAEVREAMRRCFGLLRVSAIGELSAGRWDAAASRYELLQSVIEGGLLEAPPSFPEERAFVMSAYDEFGTGPALTAGAQMRRKVRGWFGPVLDAAAKAMAGAGTGRELLVMSEPPGMKVRVNGADAGIAPGLVSRLVGQEVPIEVSDAWFGRIERKVPLRGTRTVIAVEELQGSADAIRPQAQAAAGTGLDTWKLAWNSIAGAQHYDVQVLEASLQEKSVLVSQSGLTGTKFELKRKLQTGIRYTWRMRPVRSDGTRGPWSAEAGFKGQLVWNRLGTAPGFSGSDHRQVVFHEELWVLRDSHVVGEQKVWRIAKDGTWREVLGAAPFGPLARFGLCVFDDRLWVIGGLARASKTETGQPLNDIWASRDGAAWERIDVTAPFPARSGSVCLVFNGRMWIIGGVGMNRSGGTIKYEDAWSSTDGRYWKKESDGLPIGGDNLSGAVFQGRIWLFEDPSLASSGDGITWTKETAIPGSSSGWRGVWMGTFNGQLWIVRGQPPSWMTPQQTYEQGVLSSADGRSWAHPLVASESLDFGLAVASYAEFDGRLWRIGGSADEAGRYIGYSDVWAGAVQE